MRNNKQDLFYLIKAIELAGDKSSGGQYGPFGAIIVQDGEIVGQGWNKVVPNHDPTAHAEITAIRNACQNLKTNILSGSTIYSNCEPCPMCFSAILWARIDRIVYSSSGKDAANIGFDDLEILEEVRKDWEARQIDSRQIKTKEAERVFQNWKNNPDKKTY